MKQEHKQTAIQRRANLVFLLCFLLLAAALALFNHTTKQQEQLKAAYTAESTVANVEAQLNRYLAESDLLKNIVSSGYTISNQEFASLSELMSDEDGVIKAIELAPGGVVQNVYPLAGNVDAIGLNFLQHSERKVEANLAKESGQYTIAGPFELVQGGIGALLFDPIYTADESGNQKFWGFSMLVLDWESFLDKIQIDKLQNASYEYLIWKAGHEGEHVVIAQGDTPVGGDCYEVACAVPNDTWYFEIRPKAGWITPTILAFEVIILFVLPALIALGYWQTALRRYKDTVHAAELEKSAREAQAANAAKTRFLFNMSHDIRTPMNAIIGFSELLENHIDEKDKVLDYTEKIRSSSAFLLSLTNYVLEMARIESGKAVLKEETGDLCALMQTLSDVFEPSVQQKKLTCTYHTDVEHPYIVSDRTKVREILLNVISNAIKYTPEGGHIAVSVKELPAEKPKTGRYTFTVQDDGIGMSEEYLPHIFEEFTREHTSTESKVIGTGLGLPIVKALVEWMHGSIDVQSKLGAGTTVTITLGFPLADEAQKSVEEQDAEGDAAQLRGCRILLAEDNDLNAEIVVTILEESGLTVERTADGELCIEALKAHPAGYYDAILMDIQMPNMDGYQATKLIRNLSDGRRTIPIIAMTANAFDEDRQKAFSVGMDAHLAKPVDVKRLFGTLRKVIR